MSTLSLTDLRYLYYGGGSQAEKDYLQAAFDSGVSADDVLALVISGGGGGGGSPVATKDEGTTVQLSTTTLNFVGPGVAATSGGPGICTVTVSGGPVGAAGGSLNGSYPNPTIANSVITNSNLVDMATQTIKGRSAGGTGPPSDLTPAVVTGLLSVVTPTNQGVVPASGGGTANFLRADGSWAAPVGIVQSVNARTGVVVGLAEQTSLDTHIVNPTDAHDASAVSVIATGQQTGVDAQAAVNNLNTRISTLLENDPAFLRTQMLLYDDFINMGTGISLVTGQVGILPWTVVTNNGGVVQSAAAGQVDVPGFIGIQRGTTNATGQASISLNNVDLSGHPLFIMEWRAQMSAVQVAGTQEFVVRMGLGNSIITPPTNGFWFEFTVADTNWRARCAKNSVNNNIATTFLGDTAWHRYRITSDGGGTIIFQMDNLTPVPISDATVTPTTTEYFGPFVVCNGNTGTAQRQIRIDYMYFLWGCTR